MGEASAKSRSGIVFCPKPPLRTPLNIRVADRSSVPSFTDYPESEGAARAESRQIVVRTQGSIHSNVGRRGPPDPGEAPIRVTFANGTRLRAAYWRLVVNNRAGVSSFDHGQIYGLPATIDAIKELQDTLGGKVVVNALLDPERATSYLNSLQASCSRSSTLQLSRFGRSISLMARASTRTTGSRVVAIPKVGSESGKLPIG
jgi:hypothetical protein